MLPTPEIIRCFHDPFSRLPAMELRWPTPCDWAWHLPDGTTIIGPAPTSFGVTVHRQGSDAFLVRCLWNDRDYVWTDLTANEILESSLSPILAALGTRLDYLLDQPLAMAA
jgi:hypothetical protein